MICCTVSHSQKMEIGADSILSTDTFSQFLLSVTKLSTPPEEAIFLLTWPFSLKCGLMIPAGPVFYFYCYQITLLLTETRTRIWKDESRSNLLNVKSIHSTPSKICRNESRNTLHLHLKSHNMDTTFTR